MLTSIAELLRAERDRTVPGHVNLLHYLGGLTAIFFALEVATGLLLTIYYRPSAAGAYYSTGVIMDEVRLGWLIRSVHRWGADLLILLSLTHLARVYFARAYQAPRQLNWTVGILLFVLLLTASFTGMLLPWDQYAYWYTDSARAAIAAVPVLGKMMLTLFWGGWEISEEVLLRFYALHVGMVPWLAASLVFVHVLLVWRFGIKEPARAAGAAPVPFVPDFLLNLLIAVLLVGGLLLSVSVIFPATLLAPADPLSALPQPQPRWYFQPLRELLQDLPGWGAGLGAVAFLLALFLIPALDRRPAPPLWQKGLQRAVGVAVIAAALLLGARGYLR
ncbi:MAG: cytochrome b N-terminal domain-containing protein [Deltaproteobacteria bacterium]|nr:cytochrome b N-terminal domain-containing protein [Deltaproteobacteria bacterium]